MGPFASGFSTVLQTGLTSNSFKSGMKYLLNYEPLSETNLQGIG